MRRCVWGSSDGRKGLHLLSWETMCKPKRSGGDNLKPSKEMNWAILAKLAWGVLSSEGEAWRDVLRSK